MRVNVYEVEDGGFVSVEDGHKPPGNVLPAPPGTTEAPEDFSCPCDDCKRERQEAQVEKAFRVKANHMRRTDPSYATACETLETLKSIDATLKLQGIMERQPATPAKRPAGARPRRGGGG